MDEQTMRKDAEEMLSCFMDAGEIEDVAKAYLIYEVDPDTRYYKLTAEVAIEKYPLRKPTEEERVEALGILRRKKRISANMRNTIDFINQEIDGYARQTPTDLVHLQKKLGAEQGYREFTNNLYRERSSRFLSGDRAEERRLDTRLEEIAKKLIIK